MSVNTPAQKSLQVEEIARQLTAGEIPTPAENATFRSFHRFVANVAGRPCEHIARNGHMVAGTAHKCGIVMAEDELDTLPETVDIEARLAAVAITVIPVSRYLGVKADGSDCGCTFGHKTPALATACARGTRTGAAGTSRRATRLAIPVSTGPVLALPAPVKAEPANTDTPAPTTQPTTNTPARPRLRSGAQGSTSRA